MSGICEIFPDDESCKVDDTPVDDPVVDDEVNDDEVEDGDADEEIADEEGDEGDEGEAEGEPEIKASYSDAAAKAVSDWQMVKDMSEFAKISPMAAWLEMTAVAAGWTTYSALEAFRYRSSSTYYDFAKIGSDTNWYKTSDQVRLYGGVALGGLMTIAGLMGAFGISHYNAGLTWMWAVIASWALGGALDVLRYLGFDAAYSKSIGTSSSEASSGATVMSAITSDFIVDVLMSASMGATIYKAQWPLIYDFWIRDTDE